MAKIEKIKTEKTTKAVKADKIERASTVTFTLELPVRKFMDAQAKAAGMNMTHYMQKLVETHVIEAGAADEPLAVRLAAKRKVLDQVVALATKLDAAGKFDENFILTVVSEAGKDADFKTQYELALGVEASEGEAKVKRARVSH